MYHNLSKSFQELIEMSVDENISRDELQIHIAGVAAIVMYEVKIAYGFAYNDKADDCRYSLGSLLTDGEQDEGRALALKEQSNV